jgi:hypothetical protein
MKGKLQLLAGLFGLLSPADAFAISVEVAKKCDVITAQAFPPRVAGNPAAGSAKGSGLEQQAYWQACVANGGKPPAQDAQPKK